MRAGVALTSKTHTTSCYGSINAKMFRCSNLGIACHHDAKHFLVCSNKCRDDLSLFQQNHWERHQANSSKVFMFLRNHCLSQCLIPGILAISRNLPALSGPEPRMPTKSATLYWPAPANEEGWSHSRGSFWNADRHLHQWWSMVTCWGWFDRTVAITSLWKWRFPKMGLPQIHRFQY